jgi:ABC-type polar amino acid transport system ATPase subunit
MLISLGFPKSAIGENPLQFPQPAAGGPGTITVLCGPNGSGKSFILRALLELIESNKAGSLKIARGWQLARTAGSEVAAFKPQHHSAQMSSIGALSLKQATKPPKHNDKELLLKLAVFGSLLRSVEGLPRGVEAAAQDAKFTWMTHPEVRHGILSEIPTDNEKVYWTAASSEELFLEFSKIHNTRIGLRREVDAFELVMAYPDGNAASYNNWSDGQKSLFAITAAVLLQKPTIYICDEIENYLHPELMTSVLSFLRQNVRQTIISTHHPHLIFGSLVDEVYFVEETHGRHSNYPTVLKKLLDQPTPPRRITRLAHAQVKLASAYRLFDVRDAALLATASYVMKATDYYFYDAVYYLFECSAAGASTSPFPDRQTAAIAEFISAYDPFPASVLDWGAGLGRVVRESIKLGGNHVVGQYEWALFEPFVPSDIDWSSMPRSGAVRHVSDRRELAAMKAGVALLTNVLHILTPDQWVDCLLDCWHVVAGSESGIILVTEVYPLLHPERRAVPLPRDHLTTFFRRLGFTVYSREFPVHGATSYCLALSNIPCTVLGRDAVLGNVEQLWRQLHGHFLETYRSIPKVDGPAARNEVLNAAFGMASIASYFPPALGTQHSEVGVSARKPL